jgi:splicing factor 3B subunit 2
VPRHWSQKRKYLQGKRGIEKPIFKLPDFIEATGEGGKQAAHRPRNIHGLAAGISARFL